MKKTILIVEHDFFGKIVPYWVYFGQGEDLANHGTVQKSAIFPPPDNQKRLK